jgi:iron complex outermembrane receptor protein
MKLDLKPGHGIDVDTATSTEGSSPRNQLTAQSGFDLGNAFNLDLTYRFVSALPALNIDSYSTGDARFAWRPRPYLEFALVGQNLLQPFHFEYASDPAPNVAIKRSAYAEITWRK